MIKPVASKYNATNVETTHNTIQNGSSTWSLCG